MPTYGICSDCTRLRDDLGDAIIVHIKLLGQCQMAALEFDPHLVVILEPLVLAAEKRRRTAKTDFKEHEATHSGNDKKV